MKQVEWLTQHGHQTFVGQVPVWCYYLLLFFYSPLPIVDSTGREATLPSYVQNIPISRLLGR